jgi:hypothetical protein
VLLLQLREKSDSTKKDGLVRIENAVVVTYFNVLSHTSKDGAKEVTVRSHNRNFKCVPSDTKLNSSLHRIVRSLDHSHE